MDADEVRRMFLGLSLPSMLPIITDRVGVPPTGWGAALATRIKAELATGLQPIPGAREALCAVRAAGLAMAICSNSSRGELRMKLEHLGFAGFFGRHVFSFEDVTRPKPAPDLYLAAAAACGLAPVDCLVVEDSAPGVAAGLAAGCRVVSLTPGLGVPYLPHLAALLVGEGGGG